MPLSFHALRYLSSTMLLLALNPKALSKDFKVGEHSTYDKLLRKALVWQPIETEDLDLIAGPEGPEELESYRDEDGMLIIPTISCRFVEPKSNKQGGKSHKFKCEAFDTIDGEEGVQLKVKYDPAHTLDAKYSDWLPPQGYNGEVYSEIAGSRLLWALGYTTDRMYPAVVKCFDCPIEPFTYITHPERRKGMERREVMIFPAAAIEIKAEGRAVVGPEKHGKDREGWGLDEIRETNKSSSKRQNLYRESLVAMLGILQHADNKASNQRLLCTEWEGKTCSESHLVAQDLGALFGGGIDVIKDTFRLTPSRLSKFDYTRWRDTPVWKNESSCILKVNTIPLVDYTPFVDEPVNTFKNKKISKEARDFLARQLRKLSRQQITDLFTLAQTAKRGEVEWIGLPGVGYERRITVTDWVNTFFHKVSEFMGASCES